MTPIQRALVNLSTLLVFVSGVVYGTMKYLLAGSDPYSSAGSPLQPWALALHVLSAPAMVFSVGMIVRDHIVAKLVNGFGKSIPNTARLSGLASTFLLVPMIASGYLLQTTTNETILTILTVIHVASGCFYGFFFLAHFVASRRARAES